MPVFFLCLISRFEALAPPSAKVRNLSGWCKHEKKHSGKNSGYTLIELLMVTAVVGLLLAAFASVPDVLKPNQRVAALQELAAVLEQARSQALRGGTAVFVAFTSNSAESQIKPYRQFAIFEEIRKDDGQTVLQQASAWHRLSSGLIFDPQARSTNDGKWANLLSIGPQWDRLVTLPSGAQIRLPCIGFGVMGEVVHPGEGISGPFGLAIAEGEFEQNTVRVSRPERSLSLEIRRGSGKIFMHP